MLPDIQPGNTKILYFFNCLLDGMHTKRNYICDFSRGGLNTRLYTLVSKPCSEATNIGYRFSSRAVFGWILFELNSGCGDLGERVEVFCLLLEYCR